MLRRFLQSNEGSAVTTAAIALIPLFGSIGAAVDFTRVSATRSAMQAAVDASTLSIAKDAKNVEPVQLNEAAVQYFKANFQNSDLGNLATRVATSATSAGYAVSLSASGSVKTKFLSLLGFPHVDVAVESTAISVMDGLGCVLSLNRNASGAVTGAGGTSVNLNGCSLYDNSDNATALTVGGQAQITALSVGVVGNLTGAENITTTNGIRTGVAPVTDPYADDSFPNVGACTDNNVIVHGVATLEPGVYCGGITVNGGAELKLNPGIYYIDGGRLLVNGGATLTGSGVTIVFTSQNRNGYATASVSGGATINLTAPKLGPTTGIVMFGDRRMPAGADFKLNGGSTQYFGGAVYLPSAAIEFAGGSSTNSSCTQVIGNTIIFTGNSKLMLDCSSYGTKPFSTLVVKLTS